MKPGEFLFFSWRDGEGRLIGENDFFPRAYKYYDLPQAKVDAVWAEGEHGPQVTLRSAQVSLFVTATSSAPGYFSDNAVTLLPGRETKLSFTPRLGAKASLKSLAKGVQVRDLSQTY
jgi:beta-mannosidase